MSSAVLSVIGTLAGVLAGGIGTYLTTSRTTDRTLRVQTENTLRGLDAVHGQKLQDLQTPAYEQAIAALIHRHDKREQHLSPVRWDDNTENLIRSALADYQPPNWYESQSSLELYASKAVLEANESASEAHEKIIRLTRQLPDLREEVAATDPTDHEARTALGDQHRAIRQEIRVTLKEAATADANLKEVMRASVHARPSKYPPEASTNASGLKGIVSGPRRIRIFRRSAHDSPVSSNPE
jgi:hypothetical protein